jgi:hypothetical protein
MMGSDARPRPRGKVILELAWLHGEGSLEWSEAGAAAARERYAYFTSLRADPALRDCPRPVTAADPKPCGALVQPTRVCRPARAAT